MPPKRKSLQSPATQSQAPKKSKRPKVSRVNSTDSRGISHNVDIDSQPIQGGLGTHLEVPRHMDSHNTVSNVDLNSLTETITQTVTSAVLSNLQALGILAAQISTPAVPAVQSDISASVGSQRVTRQHEHSANLTSSGLSIEGTHLNTTTGFDASSSLSNPGCVDSHASSAEAVRSAFAEAAGTGFVSAAVPLHSRVPLKTKDKIWADEYVELSTLQDESVDDVTISVKAGHISTTSSAKRRYLTIEQWTDAFSTFSSVYRLKFQGQSEQLSTYMSIVRKIANERGAWHYYDTNFRKIKAACNLSWDQIHSELYVTALSRKQPLRFRSSRDLSDTERSRTTIPFTCNKYNKGMFCSGCDYRHICKYSNCGGKHPGHKCWKNIGTRRSGSSVLSGKADQQFPFSKPHNQSPKSNSSPRPTNSSKVGGTK